MQLCKWYFPCIMVGTIVKSHSQRNTFLLVIKQRYGVHAPTQYQYRIFHIVNSLTVHQSLPTLFRHKVTNYFRIIAYLCICF